MHLISIITATYNSSAELLKTYESISSQTLNNWEWLVTDDCSSDSTYQLLLEISEKDKRVKVFTLRGEKNFLKTKKCFFFTYIFPPIPPIFSSV